MCDPRLRPSSRRRAHFEAVEQRILSTVTPAPSTPADFELEPNGAWVQPALPQLGNIQQSLGLTDVRAQYGLRGAGQTIAVIDSGVAYDHPALGGGIGPGRRIVGGWDFTEEQDGNPYDDGPAGYHGTHVAGILASQDATRTGIVPDADLVALRVFNDRGRGDFQWIEQALQWVLRNRLAFEHPITTVNLSLGSQWNADTAPGWAVLEDEFAALKSAGVFIAVAAGNNFAQYQQAGLSYPGASPHVVPVASVNAAGVLSSFSQRDTRVLAALGEDIVSTVPDYLFDLDGETNDWAKASGTSMATPLVAGASVLVREAMQRAGRSNITVDQIVQVLRSTATWKTDTVTGLSIPQINVTAAIQSVLPAVTPPVDPNPAITHELGTISSHAFTLSAQQPAVARLRAAHTGWVTVELRGSPAATTTLQPLTAPGSNGSASTSWYRSSPTRLDIFAQAGQELRFTVSGPTTNTAVQVTNLVGWNGEQLIVYGSAGIDRYELNLTGEQLTTVPSLRALDTARSGSAPAGTLNSSSNQVTLTVNGTGYAWARGDVRRITVAESAGRDELSVRLAADGPAITVDDNELRWSGENLSLLGRPETLQLVSSSAAQSVKLVVGSANARALAREGVWELTAGLQSVRVEGPGQFEIQATGTRNEVALYDSPGNDELRVQADEFQLRTLQSSLTGKGFQRVTAAASAGGRDQLHLRGTATSDRLTLSSRSALLSSLNFLVYATDFEQVDGQLDSGFDVVRWQDATGTSNSTRDVVEWSPEAIQIRSDGVTMVIRGHDEAHFKSHGGSDELTWLGTAGDDQLLSYPDYSQWSTQDRVGVATGFSTVQARGGAGGRDRAWLYGSPQSDQFTSTATTSELRGSGWSIKVHEFEDVRAASQGGRDRATFYDSAFDDRFEVRPGLAAMTQANTARSVADYSDIRAVAHAGGYDMVFGLVSEGATAVDVSFERTSVAGPRGSVEFEGFEQTQLTSEVASAVAHVVGLQSTDRQLSSGKLTTFVRQRSLLTLLDFQQVDAAYQ